MVSILSAQDDASRASQLTRRSFLRAALISSAFIAVPGALAACSPATTDTQVTNKPLRIGWKSDIDTFNPLRVATYEYIAIWRDLRRAGNWSARLGHLFRRPGWSPDS